MLAGVAAETVEIVLGPPVLQGEGLTAQCSGLELDQGLEQQPERAASIAVVVVVLQMEVDVAEMDSLDIGHESGAVAVTVELYVLGGGHGEEE